MLIPSMPLAHGTRLGPYEITAPHGAGGMDEVFRARDTRLGRDVAVKLLPLPTDDVLKLGTQIADALDWAHRAGVIHRDLKPATSCSRSPVPS